MPETFNPLDGLSSFFFGKDKNDPRVNPAVRQKIALAMMARQGRFPKNIGEGLTAVGEAIGDRRLAQQLMDADIGQQDQAAALLGAPAAPAAAAPTGYSPPSPLSSAPAVQAIDAATAPPPPLQRQPPPPVPSQPPPGLAGTQNQPSSMLSPDMPRPPMAGPEGQLATAPPPVQRSMMSPQPMLGTPMGTQPATGFNPALPPPGGAGPAEAPPSDNPYNVLDAQVGYRRQTPAYIADAIARNVPDPDRQAYLGSLVGGEAPKGPADVSPTGADGPFQFTRGTGRQYGLMGPQGDQRRDLDASTRAANAFTDKNVMTFERINGRPPSPAEMAVMHQQGGVTGARMIAGTGNAPRENLRVNNVSPNASPAAAVAKIKGYYGMPDQATPRDGVASALMAQQGGGGGQPAPPAQPPQAPAMAFSGVQPAPPDPSSTIRPMPQPQLAQAQPTPVPGYVTPPGVAPSGAPIVPMHPEEKRIRDILRANPNNPYLPTQAAGQLEPYVREREQRQKEADEKYKSDLAAAAKQTEQHYKDRADQQKRIDDAAEAEQKRKAGQHTTVDGRLMIPDPNAPLGTKWIDVTADMPGASSDSDKPPMLRKPPSEYQSKAQKFWAEMQLAEQQLKGREDLLAQGRMEELKGKVPFIGNALQSSQYRIAKNAADFGAMADLRPDSGAAIGIIEEAKRYKQLMPVPGDDAAAIKAKREARQVIIDSTYSNLGEARVLADWTKNQMTKRRESEQSKVNDEMSHIRAPKIGYEAINKKNGKTRVWTGEHWLEN